jgi:hypothetical protein
MPSMLRTSNPLDIHFSPLQHARVCFFFTVVLFGLAAGSYFWNEAVHYRMYLAMGLIFAILGLAPLLVHFFHGKSK